MSTPSKPRIAFLEHVENGVPTDAASISLQDPTGSWGIREALSETIAIPAGVPVTRVGVGMYEFDISTLNNQIEYEIFWRVVNTDGNIEYILGIIPKLQLQGAGSGGPVVPAGADGIPVDFNMDGVIDGYAYDLEGNDGYYESFDTNGDGIIDAIDKGIVHAPGYYYGNGYGNGYGNNYVPPPANGGNPYNNGQVFDARGVRIGLGGEIGGSSYGVTPPPDGIPDHPSPRGTPAQDGTWGGMPGFDGTSGYIPSTGGDRTDRDNTSDKSTKSPGFWNGISYESLCFTEDTKLLGENNTYILAKDVKVEDVLQVYDVEKKQYSLQKVTKVHINNTKTGQLCRITTKNGRSLNTSLAHPYILQDGERKTAADIRVGDKLIVSLLTGSRDQRLISPINTDTFSFENAVKSIETESLGYNSDSLSRATYELLKSGWLNPSQERLRFLARFVGHIFGDGHVSASRRTTQVGGRLNTILVSGRDEEIESIRQDLARFGFNLRETLEVGNPRSEWTTHNGVKKRIQGRSLQATCTNTLLAELLYIAGAPLGNKTTSAYLIPEWILNNVEAKREFLSAYYGSEGRKPHSGYGTSFGVAFHKINELKDNGEVYVNQLLQCFRDFGIKCDLFIDRLPAAKRKDGHTTTEYKISWRKYTDEDVFAFVENIGVTYSPKKKHQWDLRLEFSKFRMKGMIAVNQASKDAIKLNKEGLGPQEISRRIGHGIKFVRSAINGKAARLRSLNTSFEKWSSQFTGGHVTDEVESIEVYDSDEQVYDVTMETIFDIVTNGIVTQDCVLPISPRGQCVIGETLVDGEFGAKQIKDVKIGDSLKVYNRELKTFEYQKVTKIHINNTKDNRLYKVKTRNGRELTCTSKHPFIVRGEDKHVHAEKLQVGQLLVVEPIVGVALLLELPVDEQFDLRLKAELARWNQKQLTECRPEMSIGEFLESYADGNEIYDELVIIESFDSEEDVYDVTMETLFDFVTNGIVTLDCIKDQAHAATRVMLKDTDPSCFAFSEDEIDMYLETSLWAFNAKPTFTALMWDGLQPRWLNIIVKGAVVWALYAQSLLESGREFTISDNGISYTPPPVSDKMQSYASALLAHYEKELQDIKQNFRPIPAAVGFASVTEMSTSLRRLRHLRERRII